jgi:photosystem II stability/assembly factor-like uncharacterized protein
MTPLLLLALSLPLQADPGPWEVLPTGTAARLRGLSVVDDRVVWASGSDATVLRTLDGGDTWDRLRVPDSDGLDFRDLHAFGPDRAVLMACGPGAKSRLYLTTDAGKTWALTYKGADESIFLDALSFSDPLHGLALGDPVGGKFLILSTADGGATWREADLPEIPPALEGEAAFAASGTCLASSHLGRSWIVTGGAASARALLLPAGPAVDLPIPAGKASAGAFSVTAINPDLLVAVGGDYLEPDRPAPAAWSADAGKTWHASAPGPRGYRSGVASAPEGSALIAVGPSGTDLSRDGGKTWTPLGSLGFDSVSFASPTTAFASGESGRIARLQLMSRP